MLQRQLNQSDLFHRSGDGHDEDGNYQHDECDRDDVGEDLRFNNYDDNRKLP